MIHRIVTALALASFLTGCQTVRPGRIASIPKPEAMPEIKIDPGVERVQHVAEVGPDQQTGVHLDLSDAMESQGRVEEAVAEYQKAIDVAGRRGGRRPSAASQGLAHRRMAGALDRLGRFEVADPHHHSALKLTSKDAATWNDAGYGDYLRGLYPEAERKLRAAAALDPKDARILTNLGLVLAATGRDDAALEAFTRASGPAAAHANLAYVLAGGGRIEAARDHYRRALQLQPDLVTARTALAKLDANKVPAQQVAHARPDAMARPVSGR